MEENKSLTNSIFLVIILFKSITMFCGTDSISQNILSHLDEIGEMSENIPWNVVSPT